MQLDGDDPSLLHVTSGRAANLVARLTRQAADLEASRSVDPLIQSQGLEAIAGVIEAAGSMQAMAGQAACAKDQEPT